MPASLPPRGPGGGAPPRPGNSPAPPRPGPDAAPQRPVEVAPNRKLIRPSLATQPALPAGERRQRRRVMPPEQTGLEAAHYAKQVNVGTPMLLTLEDGTELRGVLDWHDRESLRLCREGLPAIVVMKRAIRHSRRDEVAVSRKGPSQRG